MKVVPRWLVLLVLLPLVGCETGAPRFRARLDDEGVVYLYLQPFPREAERLRVVIDGVSALAADGREVPLSVSLRDLKVPEVRRQRLLAAGPLPAGEYTGFVFRTQSASLLGDSGPSALLVPQGPTSIDFRMTVRRREGSVVSLALRYAGAVERGFRFSPAFSIYVPARPAPGLMGFVANSGSNDITVFDKRSLEVFDVIATGRQPSAVAVDPRAGRVYAALTGDDEVEVIDVLAGRTIDHVRLATGDEPIALGITPDGRTILSVNGGSNSVSVIDTAARAEVAKLPVGNGPRSVTIDPAGRGAFVFNSRSNTLSVIDVQGRAVVRSIPTDPGPVQGQFNRRADRLYVVHELTPYVTVISPRTLAVVARFPVRSPMDAIAVDPNTDLVYLGGRRDFAVGLYDPLSFGAVDFLDTGGSVVQMAVDLDENTLYLVSPGTNRVLVAHRIRKRVVGEIDVGETPSWIGVMAAN